jgi:gas vesicle protein
MACKHPGCRCQEHRESRQDGAGLGGFAIGVAIGTAIASLVTDEQKQRAKSTVAKQARQLRDTEAVQDVIESLRENLAEAIETFQAAATDGKAEAERTRDEILKQAKPKRPKR